MRCLNETAFNCIYIYSYTSIDSIVSTLRATIFNRNINMYLQFTPFTPKWQDTVGILLHTIQGPTKYLDYIDSIVATGDLATKEPAHQQP